MIKLTKILLLTLVFGIANATDKVVYMDLETEGNSYGIETRCDGAKTYLLKFKLKKNIIQYQNTYLGLIGNSVSIETESYTIKPSSVHAKSKSDIKIFLDESEFRKFGKSGAAKIYIDANLLDRQLIIQAYKKSLPPEDITNPYRPIFTDSSAFIYVKPTLTMVLNNADEYIKQCNNVYKEYWAKVERDKKQKKLNQKKEFKKAYSKAQKGDLKSQRAIGSAYINGIGTLKDYKKGMTWIRKAAEAGNAAAQSDLGYIYASGKAGVLKDMNKAKHWIEKGHTNGDQKAKEYWDKYELWKY